ncbi:unnamed protein product [Caenorhabditis auriculariae]|uniref:Uncharacterized protein n=1 Tax=Caenorhabditis auriculariae TaxID=2777116 RepID=A0A8S1H9I4_9PELO|nr:unnamed protein product [Caenorhabditis auriculariae]
MLRPTALLLLIATTTFAEPHRRRVSQAAKVYENIEGLHLDSQPPFDSKEEIAFVKRTTESSIESSTETTSKEVTTTTEEATTTTKKETTEENVEDVIQKLLEGALDLQNLTKAVEQEHAESLEDEANRTVLWIDASYKAMDYNLSVNEYPECIEWQKYWAALENATVIVVSNETLLNETIPKLVEPPEELQESELVTTKKRLKALGLNPELLEIHKAVGLVFREICGNHGRTLWFRTREDAKTIGIDEDSLICEPFKEELNPDRTTLAALALKLNERIHNITHTGRADGNVTFDDSSGNFTQDHEEANGLLEAVTGETLAEVTTVAPPETTISTVYLESSDKINLTDFEEETTSTTTTTTTEYPINHHEDIKVYDDDIWDYHDLERRFKEQKLNQHLEEVLPHRRRRHRKRKSVLMRMRVKRDTEKVKDSDVGEDESEDDWINVRQIIKTEDGETTVAIVESSKKEKSGDEEEVDYQHWIEIDASDALNPTLLIASEEALDALHLEIDKKSFSRFENIGLYLPGICADYVPKAIDEFNSSSFEGVEIEGPIGVNISALEMAGVNLTALAEKLRNDTEVDEILARTNASNKNLGGSFILPVLNKNQYDPFSAPIVFQGSAVVVRFGIYIESMSNFQTTTMDYDMDIYLMMSWRDARLVNPYDKPILVKEEDILEKIWRPDPFFANAKEAEFHEVTFLNFLMRIFPDGLVLYETRVKIKPSCNLILCKYPHDKQTCDLLIKSFAYPIETVRFEWFTKRKDAIDKNPDVKLPELYIDRYETTTCGHSRKSGDFSCLRAVFRLKRDVGFHIAQTYIPTSLALMFSWVGVWLPEEFMEGRIGVAITVLLTLSTESAGAREHLPSVSYLKAIDLWFGFITGFVFFTLLQTLFVIGFDKRANQLRKWAGRKKSDMTEEIREALMTKATRYHKTGRYLDNFCRVFYPLSFILFLFMYYFVFTEGRQDDCMNRR